MVSGLANGVDTYAHRGALDGGGGTIAILSTSPKEKIYPEENKDLAEEIRKKGALIYPFELPFWEANKVYGKIEHSKSRRILRFLERDILLAKLCPVIIAVSNKKISGGTKWAVNYGVTYEKSVHQYNRQGKQIPLNFLSAEIDWKTELNLFS